MRRHRREMHAISDMNLTNLLDTTLILIVALMLVSPALKAGIDLELPHVTQGNIQTGDKPIIIYIVKKMVTDKGDIPEGIYIDADEKKVTVKELAEYIERRRNENPKVNVVIEADRAVSYETVAKVLGTLKDVGVENVGLETEPEEEAKP